MNSSRDTISNCFEKVFFVFGESKEGFLLPLKKRIKLLSPKNDKFGLLVHFETYNKYRHYILSTDNGYLINMSLDLEKLCFGEFYN